MSNIWYKYYLYIRIFFFVYTSIMLIIGSLQYLLQKTIFLHKLTDIYIYIYIYINIYMYIYIYIYIYNYDYD